MTPLRVFPSLCWTLLLLATVAQVAGAEEREAIGSVLGKPVYRDEIQQGHDLRSELHRLFTGPVMDKYAAAHAKALAPTDAEIDAMQRFFAKSRAERLGDDGQALTKRQQEIQSKLQQKDLPEDQRDALQDEFRRNEAELFTVPREFVTMFVAQWKMQKHLYDNFGGGRILWQQFGTEAFDATHNWLKAKEDAKEFQITDPALRETFYAYWTTHNHGAFLSKNDQTIRETFLEPEWRKGLDEKK